MPYFVALINLYHIFKQIRVELCPKPTLKTCLTRKESVFTQKNVDQLTFIFTRATSMRPTITRAVDSFPKQARRGELNIQIPANIARRHLNLDNIEKSRHERVEKSRCKPVEKVLFLKTHKTGGSTITNILNRFGDSKNLTFVLPRQAQLFTFLWPARFRLSYTAPLFDFGANILCNHARFNKRPMNYLFPKETSRYITILRDPAAQYESVFNFMHFANPLGFKDEDDPLGTFLKFPPAFQEIKHF